MIVITLLGKVSEKLYINPHQIESIHLKPDATISMVSGKKYIVSDSIQELYTRIIKYRRQLGPIGNEE